MTKITIHIVLLLFICNYGTAQTIIHSNILESPPIVSERDLTEELFPFRSYANYSFDQNVDRLINSLTNYGIDTILLFKFGYAGRANAYSGTFIWANYSEVNLFYEIRREGVSNRASCSNSLQYFCDTFSHDIQKGGKVIYGNAGSNQFYYQKIDLFIKGVNHFTILDKTYSEVPDEKTLRFFNHAGRNIIKCHYLNY